MATASDKTQGEMELGYQHTLMYGRYTRSLGEYAREQAKELRQLEKKCKAEEKQRTKELRTYRGKWRSRLLRVVAFLWRHSFARIGEDWVFLALLGIIMALLSFAMDYGIQMCSTARVWLYNDLTENPTLQYLAWISLPVFLVLFSSGFVHIMAPQAIGSGIPEMKTILRGVVLKEYLTFRTLIAKTVGLTATLGSGMPLGKEGPLVHIASIVATLMSKLVTSFKGIYENESRNSEMLAAACAVGIACCFAAPIGGVLFSIEVTSVYFAIRNYWRGFFSAVFGALMFRLLAYWFTKEETITAVFKTDYQVDFPYDPQELFIYALIGVFGGLSGALFVWCHRQYVLFMRKNKKISSFLQKNRFLYPALVSLLITSIYFPLGLGQFLASTLTTQQQIVSLFANFTWSRDDLTAQQEHVIAQWRNPHTNIFVSLGLFVGTTFLLTILASTLPVPSGVLIPIFKMGAAFGRIIGEAMHLWFPDGVRIGSIVSPILPGGYALVGAAAFSSGVTHSISICVVISEMTGQIRHIVPVMIAVLVSNAISTLLQPSLYDSIIMIKKLPYLPDILPSSSGAYHIFVEDFMMRNIKYIWNGMSYHELMATIKQSRKVRAFPLVDNPNNMILLGSIQRMELVNLIEKHIGRDRRIQVATLRQIEAEAKWREEAARRSQGSSTAPTAPSTPLMEHRPPLLAVLPAAVSTAVPSAVALDLSTVQTIEPDAKPSVERRPSRFEVTPAKDDALSGAAGHRQILTLPAPASASASASASVSVSEGIDAEEEAGERTPPPPPPPKSILKKNNSFVFQHSGPMASPTMTPYSTVTGAEGSKIRQAIDALFRRSSTMLDSLPSRFDFTSVASAPTTPTCPNTPGAAGNPFASKKVTLLPPRLLEAAPRIVDMTAEAQREWEEAEMARPVSLDACQIDPAPFQLVERTSLLKVHSMFSLLGVNHAYVTTIGKLIGIVSLTELRKAIEDVNQGILPAFHHHSSSSHGDLYAAEPPMSPGSPLDVESGPDPPSFSATFSAGGRRGLADGPPPPADDDSTPAAAGPADPSPAGATSPVSSIGQHENSIKLIVPGAAPLPQQLHRPPPSSP